MFCTIVSMGVTLYIHVMFCTIVAMGVTLAVVGSCVQALAKRVLGID